MGGNVLLPVFATGKRYVYYEKEFYNYFIYNQEDAMRFY